MPYAIGAVGRRGSEGWVACESGGERIIHPIAPDDPYFDRLTEWLTRKGVERPEQIFFEVAAAPTMSRDGSRRVRRRPTGVVKLPFKGRRRFQPQASRRSLKPRAFAHMANRRLQHQLHAA